MLRSLPNGTLWLDRCYSAAAVMALVAIAIMATGLRPHLVIAQEGSAAVDIAGQNGNQQAGEGAVASDPALASSWNRRKSQYPTMKITWQGTYEVNLAKEVGSNPYGETHDYGSGIKTFSSEEETYWIRGDDAKVEIGQMTRHKGEYHLFTREVNCVEGEARSRVDHLAQGTINPDQKRPMCHHHVFQVLQLCYRPTTSEVYENIVAGRINYVDANGMWLGQRVHVYSVGKKPEHGRMEHYFNDEGYYLGYLSESALGNSTLEVSLEEVNGRMRVVRVAFTRLALADGSLNSRHVYSEFETEFDAAISDEDLQIEFPNGYLVHAPDENKPADTSLVSHIAVDGSIERLDEANRELLDGRVSRPDE